MSTSPYTQDENFDLPRQTTQCWVIVHSHVVDNNLQGVVDCSADAIQCSTSKTIKGGGNAQITLVPRRNYFNYIFPNDYVDVFFDVGDGRGPIRTFFGLVDRVERAITVAADTGAPSTLYHISCSDFTKIFEKTNIYFNPHVANRPDFVGSFGHNIGGIPLMMKGIVAYGTPADIILNLTHLLLGWKGQWLLPPSYPIDPDVAQASRSARKRWAKNRFTRETQDIIGNQSVTDWVNTQVELAELLAQLIKSGDLSAASYLAADEAPGLNLQSDEALVALTGVAAGQAVRLKAAQMIGEVVTAGSDAVTELDLSSKLTTMLLDSYGTNQFDAKTAMEVESTVSRDSILDLIDFSFVEYESIDGSILSTPIWNQEGFVWAIMNAYSNDIVNELFCDLRPISSSPFSAGVDDGDYQKGTDPVLGHRSKSSKQSLPALHPAVRYAPALVMREYPFSTIESVDAKEASVLGKSVGLIEFGAIFSKNPGEAGRKMVKLQKPLNDFLQHTNPTALAFKHLDVVTITTRDITSENIGRGDADVCNLIELYSDGPMGKHMKFLTQDVQPVANAVSVLRDGLRVRTYSTRFGRFSSKVVGVEGGLDTYGTRHKLCRWVLMLDHWYQHNAEYLQGVMSLRAFPELRVGFRLDVVDRRESYYVEGVNQNWAYPEPLTTSVTLSRGQRFDPYPVYVKPDTNAFHGDRRTKDSRLAFSFKPKDSPATSGSLDGQEHSMKFDNTFDNDTDIPTKNRSRWGSNAAGFVMMGGDDSDPEVWLAAESALRQKEEEIRQLLSESGGSPSPVAEDADTDTSEENTPSYGSGGGRGFK